MSQLMSNSPSLACTPRACQEHHSQGSWWASAGDVKTREEFSGMAGACSYLLQETLIKTFCFY